MNASLVFFFTLSLPPIPLLIKNHRPGAVAACEKYEIAIAPRRDLTRL